MSIREFTKSGTFVLVVLILVVLLLPFAAEQIGETTGLYSFSVTKRLKGLFASSSVDKSLKADLKVDWAQQTKDLASFSDWADGLVEAKISVVRVELPSPVYDEEKQRQLWHVSVTSCRSAMNGMYESAFYVTGEANEYAEGSIIPPGTERCGYRILSISDRCVWFEAFYGDEPPKDMLPHSVWPDFSRIDRTVSPGQLIFGRIRYFSPGDAIQLPNSNSYLMVDSFLDNQTVVFRLLNAAMRPVRDLVCVIVREE